MSGWFPVCLVGMSPFLSLNYRLKQWCKKRKKKSGQRYLVTEYPLQKYRSVQYSPFHCWYLLIVAGIVHIAVIYCLLKIEICSYKAVISARTSNDIHVENWGNSWVFTEYELDSQEAEPFYELHTCTVLHQGNWGLWRITHTWPIKMYME